nr:MAG TPA: hypothetical protein [Caudoviricetes sp.]
MRGVDGRPALPPQGRLMEGSSPLQGHKVLPRPS